MRIFYSGQSSKDAIPEVLLKDKAPDIMFTYHDFRKGKVTARMQRYLDNSKTWKKKGRKNAVSKSRKRA